jgi:hypothetical protein
MTNPSPQPPDDRGSRVDPVSLWTGGIAAAVVAALLAIAGIVIARGLVHVPLLAPRKHGTWGDASTPTYAAFAFLAALVATGVIHLLLLYTPQPFAFFGWIVGVATVLGAAEPFTSGASLSAKAATAAINVVLGLAIWSLVSGSARASQQASRSPRRYRSGRGVSRGL